MQTDDANTLHCIVHNLEANLLVEAGAGTGKTYALVSRVVALVKSGVSLENIVAITFTEAAAAELSERIRVRMEWLQNDNYRAKADDPLLFDGEERLTWSDEELERLKKAIAELDRASIQTIHSFAARLLRERPMDVGLPPGWVHRDALAASRDFAERWDTWLEWALGEGTSGNTELTGSLRYLIASGIGIAHWFTLADELSRNYHRLYSEGCLPEIDFPTVAQNTLDALRALAANCTNHSDRLFAQMSDAIETVKSVTIMADDPVQAADALATGAKVDFSNTVGTTANWRRPPVEIRNEFRAIGQALRSATLFPLLHSFRQHFALAYERERKADGVATFDDLLVWARDLLLNDDARSDLRSWYKYILLDEFQDTDPLQAEIVFYLAAADDALVREKPWHQLCLDPGRLFIVGDSKQSIYRFRSADISVTEKVKDGGTLTNLSLSENRRSQKSILKWVNAVFGELMASDPEVQAEYIPLQHHSKVQESELSAGVRVFGKGTGDKADDIRRSEAADIANLIRAYATDGDSRLNVRDKEPGCIRPANLRDVCILIRTRTGLGILERGLEDAGIPYRVEGGSLLFNTQEVQDLLNCLRAIDNPTDATSVVAALRSPAFACSDVDLLNWRDASRFWNYIVETLPEEASLVRDGMVTLRGYHEHRNAVSTSRFISDFVRDRRLDELDLAEYRPREAWRRRQFLIEQARILETGDSWGDGQSQWNLHQFILWAEWQQSEDNRIVESPVPDTDDDAVRIMTMHAAKGLEFPIVFLLDLDYVPRSDRRTVLFDPDSGAAEIAMGSSSSGTLIETPGFQHLASDERAHRSAEEIRLAYVAATRARDHLIVSQYHKSDNDENPSTAIIGAVMSQLTASLQTKIDAGEATSNGPETPPAPTASIGLLDYDFAGWQHTREETNARRSFPQAVTATQVAKRGSSENSNAPALVIEDKDAEPNLEQPWRAGRGGTAFGSALHGVLQDAVSRLLLRGPSRQRETTESLWEWLDAAIDRLAPWSADDEGMSARVNDIVRLAKQAVRNEWVVAALRAERLWPEIPVAAQVKTPRGDVAVEGIIDLLYLDHDDQLVILDYKSDDVSNEDEVRQKLQHYQWQGAAYAYAVEQATGKTVKDVRFLFVQRDQAVSIVNLQDLMDRLPDTIAR